MRQRRLLYWTLIASAATVFVLAGCGGGNTKSSAPPATTAPTTVTTTTAKTSTAAPRSRPAAAKASGAIVFKQNCASCHTLAAASASGTTGPNLDEVKPSRTVVEHQVVNGSAGIPGAQMPAFGGVLSKAQIDAVSTYVASVAGKRP